MENGQNPKKRGEYIPMDARRRPFPYEQREQNQFMQNETMQDTMEGDTTVRDMQQTSYDMTGQAAEPTLARQIQPPPHRTVFSPGRHTIKDFLTCTNLLVLINVIVYIVVMRQKQPDDPHNVMLIYEHGGMFVPAVRDLGEYYRFLTAMFLHFSFSHLFNNMACLFMMGNILEEQLGKLRLLLVYLLGGLGGSIGSYLYYLSKADYPVSAGASGAVYAIFGGYLAMIMFDKRVHGLMSPWRFLIVVLVVILGQLSDSSIGNSAHFVGFIMGFLIAGCIYLIDGKTKRGTYWNGRQT